MSRPFSPLPSRLYFSNFGLGKSFSRNEGVCGNQSWPMAKNAKVVSTTKTRMEFLNKSTHRKRYPSYLNSGNLTQTFRKTNQLRVGSLGHPHDPTIFQDLHHSACRAAPQRLHPVPGHERSRFTEGLHRRDHGLPVQNPRDVMRHG